MRVYRSPQANDEFSFFDLAPIPGGGWYATAQGVGNFQIAIVRFNADGTVLWAKQLDGRRGVSNIVALQNGGAMVLGNNREVFEYFDASVLVLDPNGNVVQETVWGREGDVDGFSEAVRFANGEVLLVGSTFSEDLFVDQLVLAKFSATGTLLWEKSYDHGDQGSYGQIIEAPNGGGFYLLGNRFGSTASTNLARFDADGMPIWGKSYDFGTEDVSLFRGILCPDGTLLLAGQDGRSGFLNENMLLLKTNADGEPLWSRAFDGPLSMGVMGLHRLGVENAVVTATSSTQFWPIVDNDNLLFRVSLDDGALQGSLAFGSDTRDFPYDSFVDGNEVVFCGLTSAAGTIDSMRPFIARTSALSADCPKDFPITEVAAPALPQTGVIDYIDLDVTVKINFDATLSDMTLSEQVICGVVSSEEAQPCGQSLKGRDASLLPLLQALEPLASASVLQVFDATGKLVQRVQNIQPAHLMDYQQSWQPGIYFFDLTVNACDRQYRFSGKLPVF
jgi:outer membrane protein assembly factor BamB